MNDHVFRFIIPQLLSQGWPRDILELVLDHDIDYTTPVIPLRFEFASLSPYMKRHHLIDFFLGRETPYDQLFKRFIKPIPFEVPELPRHHRLVYLNFLHNHGSYVPFTFNRVKHYDIVNLTHFTYNFRPISHGFSRFPYFPCINHFTIGKQPGYILDLLDFFSYGFFYFPFCNNIQINSKVMFRGPFPYATSRSHIRQIYRGYFRIDFFYKSRDTTYHYSDIFSD